MPVYGVQMFQKTVSISRKSIFLDQSCLTRENFCLVEHPETSEIIFLYSVSLKKKTNFVKGNRLWILKDEKFLNGKFIKLKGSQHMLVQCKLTSTEKYIVKTFNKNHVYKTASVNDIHERRTENYKDETFGNENHSLEEDASIERQDLNFNLKFEVEKSVSSANSSKEITLETSSDQVKSKPLLVIYCYQDLKKSPIFNDEIMKLCFQEVPFIIILTTVQVDQRLSYFCDLIKNAIRQTDSFRFLKVKMSKFKLDTGGMLIIDFNGNFNYVSKLNAFPEVQFRASSDFNNVSMIISRVDDHAAPTTGLLLPKCLPMFLLSEFETTGLFPTREIICDKLEKYEFFRDDN